MLSGTHRQPIPMARRSSSQTPGNVSPGNLSLHAWQNSLKTLIFTDRYPRNNPRKVVVNRHALSRSLLPKPHVWTWLSLQTHEIKLNQCWHWLIDVLFVRPQPHDYRLESNWLAGPPAGAFRLSDRKMTLSLPWSPTELKRRARGCAHPVHRNTPPPK